MVKITTGINGPFSGKIGAVVGCSWKGIPYMRSLPKKRTSKPSLAELANRKRFADAQAWLKPLIGFVRVGFKGFSPTVEGFVAAKSYLLKNAIEGEYPDYLINPEKMKLSYGDLPVAQSPSVSWEDQKGEMIFTWSTSINERASPHDQVMMMAYCVELGEAVFITTGVFRKTGTDELSLPDNFRGKHVEVYIAFLAADRSRQSDSVYLGRIFCGE